MVKDSPDYTPDVDFSVIRTAIQISGKMIDQILNGVHYGSPEVRHLLMKQCDFIIECKMCRSLFRSLPNFVAHKRVYCRELFQEFQDPVQLCSDRQDEEAVIIQPEEPESDSDIIVDDEEPEVDLEQSVDDTSKKSPVNKTVEKQTAECSTDGKEGPTTIESKEQQTETESQNMEVDLAENTPEKLPEKQKSTLESVLDGSFQGKSSDYQFYTNVAKSVEVKKRTKIKTTLHYEPIPSNPNAIRVYVGDRKKAEEGQQTEQVEDIEVCEPTLDNEHSTANTEIDYSTELAREKTTRSSSRLRPDYRVEYRNSLSHKAGGKAVNEKKRPSVVQDTSKTSNDPKSVKGKSTSGGKEEPTVGNVKKQQNNAINFQKEKSVDATDMQSQKVASVNEAKETKSMSSSASVLATKRKSLKELCETLTESNAPKQGSSAAEKKGLVLRQRNRKSLPRKLSDDIVMETEAETGNEQTEELQDVVKSLEKSKEKKEKQQDGDKNLDKIKEKPNTIETKEKKDVNKSQDKSKEKPNTQEKKEKQDVDKNLEKSSEKPKPHEQRDKLQRVDRNLEKGTGKDKSKTHEQKEKQQDGDKISKKSTEQSKTPDSKKAMFSKVCDRGSTSSSPDENKVPSPVQRPSFDDDRMWKKNVNLSERRCTSCNKIYPSIRGLKFHVISQHIRQLECPKCSRRFFSFSNLHQHLIEVHALANDEIEKIEVSVHEKMKYKNLCSKLPLSTGYKKCQTCNTIFWKNTSYLRHLKQKRMCRLNASPKKFMPTAARDKSPMKTSVFGKCKVCNKEFPNKASRKRHKRGCHTVAEESIDNKPAISSCYRCKQEFQNPSNCRRHERRCCFNVGDETYMQVRENTSGRFVKTRKPAKNTSRGFVKKRKAAIKGLDFSLITRKRVMPVKQDFPVGLIEEKVTRSMSKSRMELNEVNGTQCSAKCGQEGQRSRSLSSHRADNPRTGSVTPRTAGSESRSSSRESGHDSDLQTRSRSVSRNEGKVSNRSRLDKHESDLRLNEAESCGGASRSQSHLSPGDNKKSTTQETGQKTDRLRHSLRVQKSAQDKTDEPDGDGVLVKKEIKPIAGDLLDEIDHSSESVRKSTGQEQRSEVNGLGTSRPNLKSALKGATPIEGPKSNEFLSGSQPRLTSQRMNPKETPSTQTGTSNPVQSTSGNSQKSQSHSVNPNENGSEAPQKSASVGRKRNEGLTGPYWKSTSHMTNTEESLSELPTRSKTLRQAGSSQKSTSQEGNSCQEQAGLSQKSTSQEGNSCQGQAGSSQKSTSLEGNSCQDQTGSSQKSTNQTTKLNVDEAVPGTSSGQFREESDSESEFSGFSEEEAEAPPELVCGRDSDDSWIDMEEESGVSDAEWFRTLSHSQKEQLRSVEEIWVEKKPGMPIVEKTKSSRIYVVGTLKSRRASCQDQKHINYFVDDKNMKCRQCGLDFTSISNLRRHVIRHLGWKRYECKLCVYNSYNLSEMRVHLMRSHYTEVEQAKSYLALVTDLKKVGNKTRNSRRMKTYRKKRKGQPAEEIDSTAANTGEKPKSDTDTGKSDTFPKEQSVSGTSPAGSPSKKIPIDRRKPGISEENIHVPSAHKFNISTRHSARDFDTRPFQKVDTMKALFTRRGFYDKPTETPSDKDSSDSVKKVDSRSVSERKGVSDSPSTVPSARKSDITGSAKGHAVESSPRPSQEVGPVSKSPDSPVKKSSRLAAKLDVPPCGGSAESLKRHHRKSWDSTSEQQTLKKHKGDNSDRVTASPRKS